MKKIIFLYLIIPFLSFAQPDYKAYETFLQKYVTASGKVNYKKIKAKSSELDVLVKNFQNNAPSNKWSKNEQLAFWLNAYNLFTIKLVVDNYPLKKITDLDNGKTWEVQRIKIGNETYSLNQIENVIIRPKFRDARIHFALNCAAKSCPPLFNKAFTPLKLEAQLEERTKAFINSNSNQISEKKIKISKIFEWYASDFKPLGLETHTKEKHILSFIDKYSPVAISKDATIEYLEYNWNLNE